jgi:hypothetical protein
MATGWQEVHWPVLGIGFACYLSTWMMKKVEYL